MQEGMQKHVKKNLSRLIRGGFTPIMALDDHLDPLMLAELVQQAGLPAIEYTLRRRDQEKIAQIKKEFPDLLLLIGSTLDQKPIVDFLKSRQLFYSLEELCDLGVDSIISYLDFQPDTYRRFSEKVILVPGLTNYWDALDHLSMGAHLIKLMEISPEKFKSIDHATHHVIPGFFTGVAIEQVEAAVQAGAVMIGASMVTFLGRRKYEKMLVKLDKKFILERLIRYKEIIQSTRKRLGKDWAAIEDDDELFHSIGRFFNL